MGLTVCEAFVLSSGLSLPPQCESNMAPCVTPLCFLAGEFLAGQVGISDLVHHHQGREEG